MMEEHCNITDNGSKIKQHIDGLVQHCSISITNKPTGDTAVLY